MLGTRSARGLPVGRRERTKKTKNKMLASATPLALDHLYLSLTSWRRCARRFLRSGSRRWKRKERERETKRGRHETRNLWEREKASARKYSKRGSEGKLFSPLSPQLIPYVSSLTLSASFFLFLKIRQTIRSRTSTPKSRPPAPLSGSRRPTPSSSISATPSVVAGTTPGNSIGDVVIANGNVFEDAEATGPVIGRMDLTATTTAIIPPDNTTERRQLFIEVAFNDGVAPDLYAPVAELEASLPGGNAVDSTAAASERAVASGVALELSGVETYPTGGGISRKKPLVLAVSTKRKERERRERESREGGRGNSGSENRRCKFSFFFLLSPAATLPRSLLSLLFSFFLRSSPFSRLGPRKNKKLEQKRSRAGRARSSARAARCSSRSTPPGRSSSTHLCCSERTLWESGGGSRCLHSEVPVCSESSCPELEIALVSVLVSVVGKCILQARNGKGQVL